MSPSFQALNCWKQILTHVGVGMGAASFWRGAWYVLDDQLFPENPTMSALSSLALGTCGMAASQGIVARAMAVQRPLFKPVARFGALYTIAMSCVLVWRGTWVGWDCLYEHYHNELMATTTATAVNNNHKTHQETEDDQDTTTNPVVLLSSIETSSATSSLMATSSSALEHSPAHTAVKSTDPGHLTYSGLASHSFAIVALGACGVFASVLAPPAAVSVIKDLAIKVTRTSNSSATKRAGTTTYFKKSQRQAVQPRDNVKNRDFEFIPHLAGYLSSSSSAQTSRGLTTMARGYRNTTYYFKPRNDTRRSL